MSSAGDMPSAVKSFFRIPELIAMPPSQLSRRGLIQVARLNRLTNAICTPLLWQNLDLQDSTFSTRLLNSPEALQAFGRNTVFIRSVAWCPDLSWLYINAVWTHLNTIQSPFQRISTDALTHKEWGNMLS
ncbi:MAG: hypothetical protein J3R72DRAFT_492834 [Linnemannia gamsii]|nr:MAG: hypothetical protein J3R72DRAFT_492834 [Linnemannia gamsii]